MQNRSNFIVIGAGIVAAVVVLVVGGLLLSGDDGDDDATELAAATASATAGATGSPTPAATASPTTGPNVRAGEIERLGIIVEQIDGALEEQYDLTVAEGVVVTRVSAGSAAAIGGMLEGDVVLAVDDEAVETVEGLQAAIEALPLGREVDIEVLRGDDERTLTAALDTPAIAELLRSLPGPMRLNVEEQLREGELDIEDVDALVEAQRGAVRAALVIEADGDSLRARTYLGEEFSVDIVDDTVIRRGNEDIAPADLKEDEMVLVLSRDGGFTAFAIQAFGVFGADLP